MSTGHLKLAQSIAQSGIDLLHKKANYHLFQKAISNRVTASADQTVAGTVLANSTYLQLDTGIYIGGPSAIQGGKSYELNAVLLVTAVGANGIKVDLDGGTATFTTGTNINYTGTTASAVASANVTAVSTDYGQTAAVVKLEIRGNIVCSGSGSLVLRFAENANSTGVVVLRGSYIEVREVLS